VSSPWGELCASSCDIINKGRNREPGRRGRFAGCPNVFGGIWAELSAKNDFGPNPTSAYQSPPDEPPSSSQWQRGVGSWMYLVEPPSLMVY